jgi:hypothetical protein
VQLLLHRTHPLLLPPLPHLLHRPQLLVFLSPSLQPPGLTVYYAIPSSSPSAIVPGRFRQQHPSDSSITTTTSVIMASSSLLLLLLSSWLLALTCVHPPPWPVLCTPPRLLLSIPCTDLSRFVKIRPDLTRSFARHLSSPSSVLSFSASFPLRSILWSSVLQ